MSHVTNQERQELADYRQKRGDRGDRDRDRGIRMSSVFSGKKFSSAVSRQGNFPDGLSFVSCGSETRCRADYFKFYGIKLPLGMVLLFLLLCPLSEIFLIPVLVIGVTLTWTVQTYLSEKGKDRDYLYLNKEYFN